jgi:hypothetical protein
VPAYAHAERKNTVLQQSQRAPDTLIISSVQELYSFFNFRSHEENLT